jgi:hypothetical protein
MQKLLLALVCLSITTISSHAQILVNYNFGADLNPSTMAANASGSAITATWTNNMANAWGRSGTAQNLFVRSDATPASFDSTKYFEFTITPNSGYQFDLTQLSFNYGAQRENDVPFYNTTIVLRSSVDTFGSDIVSNPDPIFASSNVNSNTTPNSATLDLTGASFQNLTTATTFRIYVFDNSNTNQNITRLDDIEITGSVSVIPEPSTIALLLAGTIMLVALRHRFA